MSSYQNYATLPSVIISDGIIPVPLWAVTQFSISETYHLPAIATTGQRAILPVHDESITFSGVLVGLEREAWKFALETMAESSKRGTALAAYSQGKLGGLILISSMTIRTDMQIESLTFSNSSAKRETIDVSVVMKHLPKPGMLDKLLDVASIGVSMLGDIGGH